MKSLRFKSSILIVALAACIGVHAVTAVSDGAVIGYFDRAANRDEASQAEGDRHVARMKLLGYVHAGLLPATAVAFLVWFYSAHKNLGRAGVRPLLYSPRWAVGGFFVPILNLVRPFQVMKEVDVGSATLSASDSGRPRVHPSSLVGLWWGLCLLAFVTGQVRQLYRHDEDEYTIRNYFVVAIAWELLKIGAAAAAIALVRRVTNLQENALHAGPAIASVFS